MQDDQAYFVGGGMTGLSPPLDPAQSHKHSASFAATLPGLHRQPWHRESRTERAGYHTRKVGLYLHDLIVGTMAGIEPEPPRIIEATGHSPSPLNSALTVKSEWLTLAPGGGFEPTSATKGRRVNQLTLTRHRRSTIQISLTLSGPSWGWEQDSESCK